MIVNDFFMAIFFLLVGLEIKHEILHGHLSSFKKAAFPIIAALGGVLVPAIIFTIFNHGTLFEHGIGVPISTDIAFAIGIFMMLKNKMNPSLKIFLLALAIVDDLISILVIGILYSSNINFEFLSLAAVIMFVLILMNKKIKVNKATPYMLIALVLWFCIYKSGIHATISGVLLAFAIPTKVLKNEKESVSQKLEHKLNPLCNLFILPLFALVNTAISLSIDIDLASPNTLIVGIVLGLVIGKPLGIMLFTFIATKLGIIERPETATWGSIFSVSLLAGIGFTMAIFIAEIAFEATPEYISIAKISILGASILSIISTYIVATISSRVSTHNMKIANNTESESVA
jgi:NhaA family Na+:H+ antiporter